LSLRLLDFMRSAIARTSPAVMRAKCGFSRLRHSPVMAVGEAVDAALHPDGGGAFAAFPRGRTFPGSHVHPGMADPVAHQSPGIRVISAGPAELQAIGNCIYIYYTVLGGAWQAPICRKGRWKSHAWRAQGQRCGFLRNSRHVGCASGRIPGKPTGLLLLRILCRHYEMLVL